MEAQWKQSRPLTRYNDGMRARATGFVILAAVVACAVAAWALDGPPDELERARADMARAAREYRAALRPLLDIETRAVERADAALAHRRALHAERVVSRAEVEESEKAAAAGHAALERTRTRVAEADALVVEAEAARQLALLPPPARPGEPAPLPSLIRHAGATEWTLSRASQLQQFFAERFGRALPVSAFGQTPLHDRLGFDHREALDVAVHPDSPEGAALMAWLRTRGFSFLAFRGMVAGESTGAHIHVGEPSSRLPTTRRSAAPAPVTSSRTD
jgi:hypothetical protein